MHCHYRLNHSSLSFIGELSGSLTQNKVRGKGVVTTSIAAYLSDKFGLNSLKVSVELMELTV